MHDGPALAALAGLTLAVIAWPGSAAATAVAPSPQQVSGAYAAVSSCGTLSGVGVAWTVTNNVVTGVVLTSIPAACAGGALSLTLVGTGNTSLATAGPVTLSGTTLTLSSLTGSATATSVTGAQLSVVGP